MSSCSMTVTLESAEIELVGRAHYTVLLLTMGGGCLRCGGGVYEVGGTDACLLQKHATAFNYLLCVFMKHPALPALKENSI